MQAPGEAAVVGRGAEVGAVDQLLDDVGHGPGALVLSGEAGIGKSTLWAAGTERARRRGFTVLSCRPAAAEVRLSYASLADLLAVIEPEQLERLPLPQRRALDAALLRGPVADEVPDQRAAAAGLLSLLGALAGRGPVLLAIDDAQWLDEPTLRVVQFATRRCSGPVAILLAERVAEPATRAVEIEPPDAARRRAVQLGPLSLGALHEVVKAHTGRSLERRTLVRIAEVSAGNPFFALELARCLDDTSSNLAALPESLTAIVRTRLDRLNRSTLEALEVVSALAAPRVDLVARALDVEHTFEALGPAEDVGVVEVTAGAIRFTHPLLAASVYSEVAPSARRALHRRLSGVVDEVEERARHLALAAVGHDADATAALDEAAAHARRRGAPDAAAELLELAMNLDAGDPERRVHAAEDHYLAGNTDRARDLFETTIAMLGPGTLRARALARLGFLRFDSALSPEATAMQQQAIAEAGDDHRLRAATAMQLCYALSNAGHSGDCRSLAARAVDDAERSGDRALLAEALASRAIAGFVLGDEYDEAALGRALALEDPDRPTPAMFQPSMVAGLLYRWTGRLEEAQAVFTTVRRRCIDSGAMTDLPTVDAWLVQTACAAGDVATAQDVVEDSITPGRFDDRGSYLVGIAAAHYLAWVGRIDEARPAAEPVLHRIAECTAPLLDALAVGPLCLAALSGGDGETVVRHAYPVVRAAVEGDYCEPIPLSAFDDTIEALVMADRLDDAEAIVEWLESGGVQPGREWARAVGARCRGLLHAARGRLDAAETAFEQALAAHDEVPELRYDRARTLLAAAQCRRRRGRRRAARGALTEAAELFDAVGAARWAENARRELDRLGLQRGRGDELTATEKRVAEQAASGMTTREVAAALIVSPKTVEAHLGRIYRKLGIHSRAELGHHFGRVTARRPGG